MDSRAPHVSTTLGLCSLAFFAVFTTFLVGCHGGNKSPIGSADNPIKLFLTPSQDSDRLLTDSKEMTDFILKESGLHVKTAIPTGYIAVVEAYGTNKTDVAFLGTFAYVMAHEKFQAEALLKPMRHGQDYYQGALFARADSPVKKVEDIQGKRISYVDPASTSGHIFPAKLLKDKNVVPGKILWGSKHDSVITQVYQGQVDVGAAFFSPAQAGVIKDARSRVLTQFPDVEQKIVILAKTEPIPNDPIVFRKSLPDDVKKKLANVLMKFSETEAGRKILEDMYNITGFIHVTDADPALATLRATIRTFVPDLEAFIK